MLDKILDYFRRIPDYRVQGRITHSLAAICAIAALGTIAGRHGWTAIHTYAASNLYWLKIIIPGEAGAY
jgi:hypothetical protein